MLRDLRSRRSLRVVAFLHKVPLERAKLLLEQIVCLMNQADDRVGHDRRILVIEPRGVWPEDIRQTCRIRKSLRVWFGRVRDFSHSSRLWPVLIPERQPALTKEVFVVKLKLIEARARAPTRRISIWLAVDRVRPPAAMF